MRPSDRYPLALLLGFIAIFAALAIEPWYRQDWLLENLLVLVAVPTLVLTYRRLRFSNFAYTCLFVFLVLHEIGAHYTYSEVPWREWLAAVLFGGDLGVAYLGTQGDEWDAQKDMALATAGAVTGLVLLKTLAPLPLLRRAATRTG
jgi:putative membrane protein